MTDEPQFTRFEAEFIAGYVYGRCLPDDQVIRKTDYVKLYQYIDEALILIGRTTTFERQAMKEIEDLLGGKDVQEESG